MPAHSSEAKRLAEARGRLRRSASSLDDDVEAQRSGCAGIAHPKQQLARRRLADQGNRMNLTQDRVAERGSCLK